MCLWAIIPLQTKGIVGTEEAMREVCRLDEECA
jgi:hypothetical protein